MPSRAFVESAAGSAIAGCRDAEPVVLCAPRPRRVQVVHPCSADLILGTPPFLLNNNNKSSKEGGRTKPAEEDEEDAGCWPVFGGSPPSRADNPLVHDPNFLLNQRHHPAAGPDPTLLELGFFDHRSRTSYVHRPTYSSSSNSNSSFVPSSFAPAVRIQGFDVAACRSSHSNAGGRVLSARA